MTHEPDLIADLADLRRRARAAAELLHAQHLGALTVRETRLLDAMLQQPLGKVSSIEAEAVLHIAFRIGALT